MTEQIKVIPPGVILGQPIRVIDSSNVDTVLWSNGKTVPETTRQAIKNEGAQITIFENGWVGRKFSR